MYDGHNGNICPICKKEYFPTPDWVYKDGLGKRYCSWSCLNKSRKLKNRKGLKAVAQYTTEGELVRVYESATQAAERMGCSPSYIWNACRGTYNHYALGYIFKYAEGESK